ncbi:hypothetical protein JCM8097_009230 [Rhodosporidiobolus ruineniae]
MQRSLVLALIACAVSALGRVHFKRASNSSTYPSSSTVGPTPKAEWLATYNAAKAAGKIPDDAPSTLVNGEPEYANGVSSGSDGVCNWSITNCYGPNDIVEAPAGMYGISFDDGPLPASPALYAYLQSQNQTATHFFIGGNIRDNRAIFQQAVSSGAQLAVHTWSHPYMTTLNDTAVVGELGWTAQIIYDLSGFVPAFWRPPYGDADNRVRAIAEEVFGLTLVGWGEDSNDWCLDDSGKDTCSAGEGPANQSAIETELRGWQTSTNKSVGILGLEHELTNYSVDAFIDTYPGIKQNGWDPRCIPDLLGAAWYLNAERDIFALNVTVGTGPVNTSSLIVAAEASSSAAAAAGAAAATSTPTTAGQTAAFESAPSSSPTRQSSNGEKTFQLRPVAGLAVTAVLSIAFLA